MCKTIIDLVDVVFFFYLRLYQISMFQAIDGQSESKVVALFHISIH